MSVSDETMMFKKKREKAPVAQTIVEVCEALEARGYDPKDQLAGYLLSGDPTYHQLSGRQEQDPPVRAV